MCIRACMYVCLLLISTAPQDSTFSEILSFLDAVDSHGKNIPTKVCRSTVPNSHCSPPRQPTQSRNWKSNWKLSPTPRWSRCRTILTNLSTRRGVMFLLRAGKRPFAARALATALTIALAHALAVEVSLVISLTVLAASLQDNEEDVP